MRRNDKSLQFEVESVPDGTNKKAVQSFWNFEALINSFRITVAVQLHFFMF